MYDNPDYVEETKEQLTERFPNIFADPNLDEQFYAMLRDRHPVTGEELDLIN